MTNEERIYELCDCMMLVVEHLQCYDKFFNNSLEGVMEALKDIKQDIDNS